MDWANVRKIHTPPSAKCYPPPPPADEHALYKYNCVTGNTFSPPEAALLLVLTKRLGREGREWANYRKQEILSKVIAGIAQRDGNVSFLSH